MASSSSPTTKKRLNPFQPTPKMSSRPGQLRLPDARSPPLTTSLNSNAPQYPSQHEHLLSTKETNLRLKIKSALTPDARTRLTVKPVGARAAAPNSRLEAPAPAVRAMDRAITPSDSEGSLAETLVTASRGGLGDGVEELGETEAVLVTVRVRPPNDSEIRTGEATSIWTTPIYDQHVIKLERGREGGRDDKEWIFDRILPPESDNARAYSTSARAHIRSAMEGFNAVIFAYGQTASGKTFTLTGSQSNPGIIPLSITDLFSQIRSFPDREFLLRASYLELYNETILDLLSPEAGRELSLSEGKKKGEVVINGLTECAVRTEEEVKRLLRVGEDRRKVGGTDWNQRSSRSHCVFRIVIESRARSMAAEDSGSRTPGGRLKSAGEKMTRISTLSIIDLAGSEKHTSSKERNAEGKHINQSLLTLKLVISKLADIASKRNVSHVPFRDSKLTRLLQPSLSGDALISVICTVSPSSLNQAESLSTLSFAQGLKRVVLHAQKKEVVDPQALIQQYQNEIAELKALLREKEGGGYDLKTSKGDKQKNDAMEKRLNELKSLILTSVNVSEPQVGRAETRPLSPTKLKYPKLDFDRSSTELHEDLHAAELRNSEQQDEISRLRSELEARPLHPEKRIVELQDEVSGLKLIATDYERHLREPSRKVREDVEREWSVKVSKLEDMLESKRIWANRLDENVRAVTAENKELQLRCKEAESKVLQIMEWVNAALLDDPASPTRPVVIVTDDFAPSLGPSAKETITKMSRAQLSHMDLASFSDRFGTLTLGGGARRGLGNGNGHKMLREESRFDLAGGMGDDEVF